MLLHSSHMGGLGLHNVKYKALACLIRTFLETAVNPSFQRNLFHSILFRIHVLGDDSVPVNPPLPPYYSASFFQIIHQVKENTPLNVATMSNVQWYQLLVEQEVTMMEPEDSPRKFIECRVERMSPTTSWETSWRRARLRGLGS